MRLRQGFLTVQEALLEKDRFLACAAVGKSQTLSASRRNLKVSGILSSHGRRKDKRRIGFSVCGVCGSHGRNP